MNVYPNFLPVRGKVNTDEEILLNTYAAAYDAVNGQLLTATPGEYDPATIKEVKERFTELKRICRKYAPSLIDEIERIEMYSMQNVRGELTDQEYIVLLRKFVIRHGVDPKLVNVAEQRINAREGMFMPYLPPVPVKAVKPKVPQIIKVSLPKPQIAAPKPPKQVIKFKAPMFTGVASPGLKQPRNPGLKFTGIKAPKISVGIKPPKITAGIKPPKAAPHLGAMKGFKGLKPFNINAPRLGRGKR